MSDTPEDSTKGTPPAVDIERVLARGGRIAATLIGLLFAAILARSLLNYDVYLIDALSVVLAFGVPIAGIVSSIALWLARPAIRANALILTLAVAIPLYATEGYLTAPWAVSRGEELNKLFAAKRGVPFDPRTPLEVIRDEVAQGRAILPTLSVSNVPFASPATGPAFMRGSIANDRSLGGNESGTYIIYENDEYGFKNPKGIWGQSDIAVMAVGDSFTHATSVPMSEDIVGNIRKRLPNSLNLGWNGIGPLYYYQNVVEYASRVRPKYVLFVWYEGNDVTDLLEEEQTPLLSKYIGRTKPFGLFDMQKDLDNYHRRRLAIDDKPGLRTTIVENVRQFVMLYNVRKMLGLGAAGTRYAAFNVGGIGKQEYAPLASETLATVLRDARDLVAGWGGQFIFVYLPTYERLCAYAKDAKEYCPPLTHDFRRGEVLDVVKKSGIGLVDMTPILEQSPDVNALFYFPGSHFTTLGYRLVADQVLDTLGKLGAFQTPVK